MRVDLMGGLLATAFAAPVLIVCCGGGAALLAGLAGAFGGWASGLNWIAVAVAAAGAALAWRTLRRRKNSGGVSPTRSETDQHG